MNRFVRKIAAVTLAVAISAGAAVSASAQNCVPLPEVKTVELDRLGDRVAYSGYPDYGVSVLVENCTVKKSPIYVKPGDTPTSEFVVPKGKKLVLKKGAVIDGSMYIEKGATVSVSGGTLKLNGRLICDGALNIGEKATMSLADGSRFVVNTSGTFRYNADGITINRDADYACFGKFTYKYLGDSTAQAIAAKPLCVLTGDYGNLSMVTDEKSIDGYVSMLRDYGHGNPGSTSDSLYFIMGNGSRIRVDTAADSVSNIAGVRVLRMIELTDELLKR